MAAGFKRVTVSKLNSWTPLEGEICEVVTEQGKHYKNMIYHNGAWQDIQMGESGIEMGLYDMNKQIISQLPNLENINEKIDLINNYGIDLKNQYYMLYGKEISYFTIFKIKENQYFGDEVIGCLSNIGDIKAIDLTEGFDAVEIWVMAGEEPTCLYLFPYDSGIVQVGE